MRFVDKKEVFEKYYQAAYDFNTLSLTGEEVDEIKALVKEKRVDYALAPMGGQIFSWMKERNPNIYFEQVDFKSDKIDGMLYIPVSGLERAYIILNSNRSLGNQIFTAAHEYYHYVKDYTQLKQKPYICDFRQLKNVNEKKASRFAAELLLPEEALKYEMKNLRKQLKISGQGNLSFAEYAAIAACLTLKYEMPLKAVIYRLYEEGYIDDIKFYIENYEFLKNFFYEVKLTRGKFEKLYAKENPYLVEDNVIYRQMKNVYASGFASREEILRDAKELGLDETAISEFFDTIEEDDTDDDAEMLAYLNEILEA